MAGIQEIIPPGRTVKAHEDYLRRRNARIMGATPVEPGFSLAGFLVRWAIFSVLILLASCFGALIGSVLLLVVWFVSTFWFLVPIAIVLWVLT